MENEHADDFNSTIAGVFATLTTQTEVNVIKPLKLTPEDPVSPRLFLQVYKTVKYLTLIISLGGVSTNAINLRTFWRMGLEDNVTITFFVLSCSDFIVCFVAFAQAISGLCDVAGKEQNLLFYLPPFIAAVFIEVSRKIFTLTTVLITTFLAIQRALCVLFPFHVKGLFTTTRSCCFFLAIFPFSITCYALFMWRHQVVEVRNPIVNFTHLTVRIMPGSKPYLFLAEIFAGIILNIGCQFIIVVCLVVMFRALRKSMRFRESATREANPTDATSTTKKGASNTSKKARTPGADAAASEDTAKPKETQALKQVALISTVFVSTNSAYLGYGVASVILPEFGIYRAYHNLYRLVVLFMAFSEVINSTVNFFIYYNYNTKFRKVCALPCKKA